MPPSTTTKATTAPPWSPLFKSHLTSPSNKSKSFTLATVTTTKDGTPVPRSRTCELRGFFPEVFSLHRSAADALEAQGIGRNPDGRFESDMPVFTTDVRMSKLGELGVSGGVVEGVFWLEGVGVQWRVRGRSFVFGGGDNGDEDEEGGRGEVWSGVRVKDQTDQKENDWDWERMVTTYFASHSPVMRGSFRNPPPGQPRSVNPDDLKIGDKVEDLKDPIARKNFRVVVIRPDEVEMLDLSTAPDAVRKRWTVVRDGQEEKWEEMELWP
ncbi:uncharacterized protein BP01DRAFT_419908 [Aspergillus saccharolyticus JOP 1030-1]|uniref:Pyridoxamine 5'-phosphate oxidase Alr4036 family FMN-binding domain-containing protein n=1 Tax=Aspergillus saccharolyticus JOP 1030-1 TaxID=1450539 RepID=A0A318ZRS5_9EURO|nr:hypothetical protein BP01DRAFT_419908 [Aspergillus saccharolyticus JOP 1030-1]PYH49777.1 hypothetical protein BP01DRAFT_419908 [Aspergillus saccharolyticus JOP 1030-1]